MTNSTLYGLTSTATVGTTLVATDTSERFVDDKQRKVLLGTTVGATATTIAGGVVSCVKHQELHEKYATSYVQSLSDEELELALQQAGLLEEEMSKNTEKTI